ncbi:hypothetical protein Ccar_06285 [Clostridium carboxidivorans P7]|uniref:Uncharacterized protein n=1 Tax=Clostridium carboxidivorans P7 TaxID=536227 RepID=C6PQF5_9CLOT|nr:hypothetical protein [Clostridium carboxidivorans]AKN30451.1 hypothetical protein Ccar_06285 [Clostridium carboxidivorans P7]EET88477.1 hypothetical protein CcarbDRAFT_1022 [Clostridium carboxidivorans P7]EFG86192.1 hypothetical protein CLCAR_4011 [Clostridium carboxidivorans P7]
MNFIFDLMLLALVMIPIILECIKTNRKRKLLPILIYFNLIIISFFERLSVNSHLIILALCVNLFFAIRFIYVEYNDECKRKK